jgi:hypothetical protein
VFLLSLGRGFAALWRRLPSLSEAKDSMPLIITYYLFIITCYFGVAAASIMATFMEVCKGYSRLLSKTIKIHEIPFFIHFFS